MNHFNVLHGLYCVIGYALFVATICLLARLEILKTKESIAYVIIGGICAIILLYQMIL